MEDYDRVLEELNTDFIAKTIIKKNYGKSIDEIYNLIQMEYLKNTSSDWFNGDIVLLYPSIKESKSKKQCDSIHGAYIGMNASYINYHALLINVTSGSKYVLEKPLRFELNDNLPMNISDLEELERTTEMDIPIRRVDKTLKKVIEFKR